MSPEAPVAGGGPALLANNPSSPYPAPGRIDPPAGEWPRPYAELLSADPSAGGVEDPDAVAAVGLTWPEPEALLDQFDALAANRATAKWAAETAELVRRLCSAAPRGSGEAVLIVGQLRQRASQAHSLAADLDDRGLRRELLRVGYALGRRLEVWQQLVEFGPLRPLTVGQPRPDPQRLSSCLAEIERITGNSTEGRAWREYLLVDALREWTFREGPPTEGSPRAVARRVLDRLGRANMSVTQRQFVSSRPVAALEAELRRCVAEPIDPAGLLAHLERYEKSGLGSDARLLAADCLCLGLDGDGGEPCCLVGCLEAHYRNANLRVAVTEELLDRLMPQPEPERAAVRDTILGRPVRGRSVTSSAVGIDLVPDPDRVRLALEITGQVAALTSSTAGPAVFHSDSTSKYTARKPMELNLTGIRSSPAEVEVHSNSRLRQLQTEYDEFPLLGGLVKNIARSQLDQHQDAVIREVKHKVTVQARQRIDSEANAQLNEVSRQMRREMIDPLMAARLDPTIIDAETTEQRLTMRLRLAGEDQLGGHTPRPQAPRDSLASFQIHQTAINNVLERLELDGRTFTLPELTDHVTARLGRPAPWEVEPEHENVTITFARQNAMGVSLQDGQVVLQLAVAKLRKAPRSWNDFTVCVRYEPQLDGRSAKLIRDGGIELGGRRLTTGTQIVLVGIFAKTFPKRRALQLTPDRFKTDPALADLAVTQFTIEDGWIGVAVGPNREAVSRMAVDKAGGLR